MDSRSLDDLAIEELAALPKWAVPPWLHKTLEEALAAVNRDLIKKAGDDVAPETYHDPRGLLAGKNKRCERKPG